MLRSYVVISWEAGVSVRVALIGRRDLGRRDLGRLVSRRRDARRHEGGWTFGGQGIGRLGGVGEAGAASTDQHESR